MPLWCSEKYHVKLYLYSDTKEGVTQFKGMISGEVYELKLYALLHNSNRAPRYKETGASPTR